MCIKIHGICIPKGHDAVEVILRDLSNDVQDLLEVELRNDVRESFTINLAIWVTIQRQVQPGVYQEASHNFLGRLDRYNEEWYQNACHMVNNRTGQFLHNSSNWTLKSVNIVIIHINKHKILNHHKDRSDVILKKKFESQAGGDKFKKRTKKPMFSVLCTCCHSPQTDCQKQRKIAKI